MGISRELAAIAEPLAPLLRFFTWYERFEASTTTADFVAGNPQEMALPAFVSALQRAVVPTAKDHFAYKMNVSSARRAIVDGLARIRGTRFDVEDVFLTNGAFAGLICAIRAVCDRGDEVIFISPPWFFYEAIIRGCGALPKRVRMDEATFDLDLDAIARAITPRTRAIIVNSPNNPTGRIYPRATLDRLGQELTRASERHGRAIYLVSDEAYSRILFDGRRYESPTESYARSILVYTYGKQLLTPGERIGYLALPPQMPDREQLRMAITMAQLVTGYAFPNATLQYALGELERISIDLPHLQRKRDRMVKGLREVGYELHVPEGAFYLLPRSPWLDEEAFVRHLAEREVLVLPGTVVEMPGRFRLSVTASDSMIDRALPVFAAAIKATVPA